MIIERIGKDSYQLGESPIWDPQNRLLYFVDSLAGAVLCHDPKIGTTQRWDVSCDYLGSLALRAGGGGLWQRHSQGPWSTRAGRRGRLHRHCRRQWLAHAARV